MTRLLLILILFVPACGGGGKSASEACLEKAYTECDVGARCGMFTSAEACYELVEPVCDSYEYRCSAERDAMPACTAAISQMTCEEFQAYSFQNVVPDECKFVC